MKTAWDKLNEIYDIVTENKGCVCLLIKNPTTTSYDNLCASAGYGGNPETVTVCNHKWAAVVNALVFPDLTFSEFKEQFNNDPNFRKSYFEDPQTVRTKWIEEHKDLVYKKCLEILGLTETQAKATPYSATCKVESSDESKSEPKPEPKPNPKPEPKHENENNSQGKHPLKSKTVWFAISLLIASILTQYFHVNVSPQQIMEVIAVIITILRVLTKEPLRV